MRHSETQPFLWFGYAPAPPSFPVAVRPDEPCAAEAALSRLVTEAVRQTCYARPLVWRNGDEYVTPFLQPDRVDFEEGLRPRSDLKTVVHESLQDLRKRDLVDWLDPEELWRQHQNRRRKHADALTPLASLEINLKTQGETGT